MTFWSQTENKYNHFQCIPLMENWFVKLLFVLRGSRNNKIDKPILFCAIFTPCSLKEDRFELIWSQKEGFKRMEFKG